MEERKNRSRLGWKWPGTKGLIPSRTKLIQKASKLTALVGVVGAGPVGTGQVIAQPQIIDKNRKWEKSRMKGKQGRHTPR